MRKGDGSGRAAGSAAGSGRQVRVRGSGSGRRRRCSLSSLLSHEATAAADTTHSEGENQEKRPTWMDARASLILLYWQRERDGRAEEQSEWAIRGASSVHWLEPPLSGSA
jgi:hypothetical protein